MRNERITASLNALSLPREREDALLGEILKKADAFRAGQTGAQSVRHPTHGRARPASRLKWLIPAVALILTVAAIFTVPGMSRAISDWFNDLFRVERYMYAGRGEGAANPDIDRAIQPIGKYDQTYEILYSGSTADDAWRKNLGQKTLSETDLDWISEIVPEVSEVLYDGRHLVINLFYKTDPLPFARGYLPGVEGSPICDILCAEYALTVDGEAIPQSSYSHGLDFSKWFERMDDPRFSIDDVRADGGVYGQVTIDFPTSPALPNGTCKAELHMSVLAQTDPSGPESRVATIVQQFSFDTVKANADVRNEILKTQRFSGGAVATIHHYGDVLENPGENAAYKTWDARGNRIDTSGGQWVENQLVDLSNLAVTPIVHRKSTGLSIELQYKLPEN